MLAIEETNAHQLKKAMQVTNVKDMKKEQSNHKGIKLLRRSEKAMNRWNCTCT